MIPKPSFRWCERSFIFLRQHQIFPSIDQSRGEWDGIWRTHSLNLPSPLILDVWSGPTSTERWGSWRFWSLGMRGASLTHCQITTYFQQTPLLPEIWITWSERREDSSAICFPYYLSARATTKGKKENFDLWPYVQCIYISLFVAPNEYSLCNFQTGCFD